jgi:cellulose synthase/poly-beta-1,6-N-acetylglucosamine synthase-like glycosyltransferase
MSSIATPFAVLFWLSAAIVFFSYAGYPLVIWCLARCFGQHRTRPAARANDLPFVSLLIAAHNEEAVIEDRVRNALELDYPSDKLEIVVASDGSDDATAEIVQRYEDQGVRLLEYTQRRGKAMALNSTFPKLQGDIVALSDANTNTDPQALRKLVCWFEDPEVGAVCGKLVLTDVVTGRNVDSLYWKYETFLKRCESRLGALLGSNGAIYAIRHKLFAPIPSDTILDDFVIPLQAKVRTDCAIVYDTEAVAYEETAPDVRSEFRRRTRIGAGGFQSIGLLWKLLDPRRGWVAFTFFAHKILRWCCPFFMVAMLLSNLVLCDQPFYQAMMFAQLGFYTLSVVMSFVPPQFRALKPLRLTTMFTSMNAALLFGFWRWMRGSQKVAWQRTVRVAEANRVGLEAGA